MAKKLTIAEVKRQLSPKNITVSSRYVHDLQREYRVNFVGGTEATAYYTEDLDDALETGMSMAAGHAGTILSTAVFKVQHAVMIGGKVDVACVTEYVRLTKGLSMDRAVPLIAADVAARCKTHISNVHFQFWADGFAGSGGSPQIYEQKEMARTIVRVGEDVTVYRKAGKYKKEAGKVEIVQLNNTITVMSNRKGVDHYEDFHAGDFLWNISTQGWDVREE